MSSFSEIPGLLAKRIQDRAPGIMRWIFVGFQSLRARGNGFSGARDYRNADCWECSLRLPGGYSDTSPYQRKDYQNLVIWTIKLMNNKGKLPVQTLLTSHSNFKESNETRMGIPHPWYSVSSQSVSGNSWNTDDGRAPHPPPVRRLFSNTITT